MTARRARAVTVCLVAALVLTGCDATSRTSGADPSPPAGSPAPTTSTSAEPTRVALAAPTGLPPSLDALGSACTTGVGTPRAAAREGRAGVRPLLLFEAHGEEGALLATRRDLPDGWLVQPDDADLAQVQLVGCSHRRAATPNGTRCPVALGSRQVELELLDALYDLTVVDARSGAPLGSVELDARSTQCPGFVSLEEGSTRVYATPSDEQLVAALRPFVVGD